MNIKIQKRVEFPYVDRPVEFYSLENGHKIVFAYKPGKLLNVSTWIKTGSINEDDSNTGISHFLEHLMFKGSPRFPAGEFDRILESKGAVINAATWKDYTFYYVTLPKGEDNQNLTTAIEMHADMMLNPLLPDEEIGAAFDINNPDSVSEKRERFVVIEEIRMRDDNHWTITYDQLNELMYKVHPYKRDVIGTAEVIASVPRQTIMDYYKNWYSPENMTTIVVGEFDPQEVVELVRKNFVFPENRVTKEVSYEQEPEQTEVRYAESSKKDINTGFLIMGFHGPKPKNLKDNICVDILSNVLGEGKSSRMYQNLIEKQQEPIFNVVGSTQYEFKDGNIFLLQANFSPDKKDQALELVKQEIQKVCDEPISESELLKAKKRLKASFAEESETVSDIGELIGHCMTVCGDVSSHIEYLNTLETLTEEDVLQVAKKYFDLNRVSISVLVPEVQ